MSMIVLMTTFLSIILTINFLLMIFLVAGLIRLNDNLQKAFLEIEENHKIYLSFLMTKNDLKKQ